MTWHARASSAIDVPAGEVPIIQRAIDATRRLGSLGASFLVAALFAPVAALGSARKALLACVLLDIPLQIDQNLLFRNDAAELGALAGYNVSVTTVALTLLYAAWLVEGVVNRRRARRIPYESILPFAAYVFCSALSAVRVMDMGLYGRGLFLLVQMVFLALYLVCWIRTWRDVRFVLTCLLGGVVLESLIIIGLGVAGESVRIAGVTGRVDPHSDELGAIARFGGTVGSPNNAAAYLEMLLAPSLAVLATRMNWPYKILGALALVLGTAVLVLTQSRGGWIAGMFSLAVVALLLSRGRRIAPAVPIVLVVLLSAIALVFHGSITSRLADDDRGAARSRVPLMVTAFDIIGDSPVFGVGANNYARALEGYRSIFGSGFFYTVHNQYLLVWAETGLLGLAAFMWFLLATLRRGWRLWKRNDALLSPLALGFTAALAGQMVHMQVDLFSSRPQIQLLVVVAALVGVMSRLELREGHPGGRRAARACTP